MIHEKIKATKTKMELPVLLDTLIEKLDTYNAVKVIFVISFSVDPRWTEKVEGYACSDSESRALKICFIVDAWESSCRWWESTVNCTVHADSQNDRIVTVCHILMYVEKQRNLLMMLEMIQVLLSQTNARHHR